MPVKITSLDQLKKESAEGAEFFILLNYNLRSSKWIVWDREEGKFFVRNIIDDTEQVLTEKQIMNRGYTSIGHAMTKGAPCCIKKARSVINMAKPEKRFPEKQCIEGICQFCGRDGYYDEEEMSPRDDLQDGWIALNDVTAQIGGVYGEWCCRECFWNDLLCQTTTESVKEYEEKKNEILKHLKKK